MANEEHLKIIKQGVEVWNRWREENPASGADLSRLSGGRGDIVFPKSQPGFVWK